jgi:MraZ protein
MLLTGTYPRTLDDKKRLVLPRRVREQMNMPGVLYVTPGPDQCLWVFTQEALDRLADKLDRSPETDADVRVYQRLFFARSEAVNVDRAGRILVPERSLQFAGLKHEVVLIGVRDHLEVWDVGRWEQYLAENASRFDAVAEGAFQKHPGEG